MEEHIENDETLDKGKNYVIREICRLDNSKTPEELKKFVFSELVKMKKELSSKARDVDPPDFNHAGAYRFSSYYE
tara:strand:- start:18406 stop:18630 length:225 start_codon:yes stop_codon:yes gene_type:complete